MVRMYMILYLQEFPALLGKKNISYSCLHIRFCPRDPLIKWPRCVLIISIKSKWAGANSAVTFLLSPHFKFRWSETSSLHLSLSIFPLLSHPYPAFSPSFNTFWVLDWTLCVFETGIWTRREFRTSPMGGSALGILVPPAPNQTIQGLLQQNMCLSQVFWAVYILSKGWCYIVLDFVLRSTTGLNMESSLPFQRLRVGNLGNSDFFFKDWLAFEAVVDL